MTELFEHMVLGDGEILERAFAAAREREVFWTPTLCLFDKMAHDGDERYIEDYRPEGTVSRTVLRSLEDPAARWRKPDPDAPRPPWTRTVDFAGAAHAAGVRLALGTDAGMPVVFSRSRCPPRARAPRVRWADASGGAEDCDRGGSRQGRSGRQARDR